MSRYFRRMMAGATRDFLSGLVALGLGAFRAAKTSALALAHAIVAFRRRLISESVPKPAAAEEKPDTMPEADPLLPVPAAKAEGERPKRKTPWHLQVVAATGAVGFAILMSALIINLRFAATVLPEDEVDLWTINRPTSLTFLDREGEELGQRGIRYADPVPLDELPPYLVDAFLATEDRRFYGHGGYDTRGLLRALFTNVRAGAVVEGGSTITQQLAKNLFLGSERTFKRKFEELQFALWLEARLSKDEILSLYLNRIYLGAGTYGVEAASQAYFSKSARDLTIGEAALLAGLPKAPSSLAPTVNPEGAIARSREVIDNLRETRRLGELEARMAKEVPPLIQLAEKDSAHGYYLDYVAARIEQRLGTLDRDLVVSTTLDRDLQKLAEEAVRNGINEEARKLGAQQAAIVVFDRQGGIVAMAGGLDYEESQFNRATQARRQPGSAFKPFVFLAAMEAGLNPDSVLVDQPVQVGEWRPTNYSDRHVGPLRLSQAAALSTNSVAVQITEGIGRDRVIDAAHRAGIVTDLSPVASLALGSVGVPLIELTAAYMPFAHSGAERPSHAVTKIRTRQGEVLYEYEPIEGYNVIEPSKADDTARLLINVMERGTGIKGRFGDHQLAGKTGTTNDWRDAWFIGFSHYYVTGVWVGNDEATGMSNVSGSTIPLAIWKDFMVHAHEGLPAKPILRDRGKLQSGTGDVAGLYASLRGDLINTAFPIPDVDWDTIEGGAEAGDEPRRRGLFGFRSRNRQPEPPRQSRVVGNAAPGLVIEEDDETQ